MSVARENQDSMKRAKLVQVWIITTYTCDKRKELKV